MTRKTRACAVPPGGKQNSARMAPEARRLLALWEEGREPEFYSFADDLINGDHAGILADAIRLAGATRGAKAAAGLSADLKLVAQMDLGVADDSGELVSIDLMVAGVVHAAATPPLFAGSLQASGMFPEGTEVRIADGWCRPEDITMLSPCAMRRALQAMATGRAPDGVPLRREPFAAGVSILVGIAIYPRGEDDGNDGPCVLSGTEGGMDEAFSRWRGLVTEGNGVPMAADVLCPCLPSLLPFGIAEHLEGMGVPGTGGPEGEEIFPGTPTLH